MKATIGDYVLFNEYNMVFKLCKALGGKNYGEYTDVSGVLYVLEEKRRTEATYNLHRINSGIANGDVKLLKKEEAINLIK